MKIAYMGMELDLLTQPPRHLPTLREAARWTTRLMFRSRRVAFEAKMRFWRSSGQCATYLT